MAKYHINLAGEAKLCTAKRRCRLGGKTGEENHFKSLRQAQKAAERILETEFGGLAPTMSRNTVGFQPFNEIRKVNGPNDQDEHAAESLRRLQNEHDEIQIKALDGYAGFGAGVINTVALGRSYDYYKDAPDWRTASHGACDFHSEEELIDYMEVIDESLKKRQEESRVLYRGVPIYRGIHQQMENLLSRKFRASDTESVLEGLNKLYAPGTIIHHSSYLSTSSDPAVAAERTDNIHGTSIRHDEKAEVQGIMFELKTNAGVDITGAVKPFRQFERETVIPRGTVFKVVSIETRPELYRTETEEFTGIAAVVQMIEVDSETGEEITHQEDHMPSESAKDLVQRVQSGRTVSS